MSLAVVREHLSCVNHRHDLLFDAPCKLCLALHALDESERDAERMREAIKPFVLWRDHLRAQRRQATVSIPDVIGDGLVPTEEEWEALSPRETTEEKDG